MEKVEKDGKVAVLYSPGYGAGWSSWASEPGQGEVICMDSRIVGAFLEGGEASAEKAALEIFPNFYTGGADELRIEWVPKGAAFEILEYDGSESVRIIGECSFLIA